jgi:hypothetical protein
MPKSLTYTLARIEAACRACRLRELDIQRLLRQLETTQGPIGRPKNLSEQERREQEAKRLQRMINEIALERNNLWAYFLAWRFCRQIRAELRSGGSLERWSPFPKSAPTSEKSASTSQESRASSEDAEGGK